MWPIAMGGDGQPFFMGKKGEMGIHNNNTPACAVAEMRNAGWSIVLIVSGSFDTLNRIFCICGVGSFNGNERAGVFILRYK